MLMVTTTVGMLDWVHCDTSNSWPVVSLCLGLEPRVGGLEEGLVGSLSSSAHAYHSSAASDDGLSGARWKSDSGFLSVFGVTNDNSRCA